MRVLPKGLQGAPHQAHYVASKHGIQGLGGALANELGPHGIRVNSVNPDQGGCRGGVRTYTLLPIPWVQPEDVANAVLWLGSDEARYVTGIAIPVEGGMIAKF